MSDANALKECWEEVLRRSDYDKRKKEVEEFNRRSKSIKKGIAVMPMKFPVGLPGKGRMQAWKFPEKKTIKTLLNVVFSGFRQHPRVQ